MLYVLLTLILTTLICFALGLTPRWRTGTRWVALLGVGVVLALALFAEGLQGGGVAGAVVKWPDFLGWLGATFYRSDTLSAGLGAWCLLLGGLCLLDTGDGASTPRQQATALLTIATLYSLVHTADLRAFAAQTLLLAVLAWLAQLQDAEAEVGPPAVRGRVALGMGALMLLAAVLLMGRTTGGVYNLADLSLSALIVWPLLLIAGFVILWLGVAPCTGWGAMGRGDIRSMGGALLQSLVVGVPVVALIIRLQALITQQALAGSVPTEWTAFTGALVWLGAATALIAGAGAIVWAGLPRWTAFITAHAMGLCLWALGLDTPAGRYAALAILLAYGASRVALGLAFTLTWGNSGWAARAVAGFSLAGAPLTAGFVGIWLLASALEATRHPAFAIFLAAAVLLAAYGTALHLATIITQDNSVFRIPYSIFRTYLALALSAALLVGGALPGLWLPQVVAMANIAGSNTSLGLPWTGVETHCNASIQCAGLFLPLPLLALVVLFLALAGWLLRLWAKSGATSASTIGTGVLLTTALSHLQNVQQPAHTEQTTPLPQSLPQPLLSNPPTPIWWLSLIWLERGIYGSGTLFARLAARTGSLLSRLEGRYYLPLALVLILLMLLAITR